ncbi:MAG: hypothetical protein IJP26_01410 [Clostridia bacterium]|nr:hypothetical protein [Clostridia bacterium]
MKEINFAVLSAVFCGCFLGAGFLSGNELLQFFGNFGFMGVVGCFFSVFLISFFSGTVIKIAKHKKTNNPERILFPSRYHKSSLMFGVLQVALTFSITVIMLSGITTLLNQLTNINRIILGVFFTFLLFVIAVKGNIIVAKIFSYIIPVIIIFTFMISFVLLKKANYQIDFHINNSNNPLLKNWVLSALTYVSYSVIYAVAAFSSYGKAIKNGKDIWVGVFLGGALMFLLALSIMFSIFSVPNAQKGELPMFLAAANINSTTGCVFSVLLVLGMFSAALTAGSSLVNYINIKLVLSKKYKEIAAAIIFLTAFFCSVFKFGNLIGTIYPTFGYFGFVVLFLLILNLIHIKTNTNY